MVRESVESICKILKLRLYGYHDQELNISGFFLFFVFSEDSVAASLCNKKLIATSVGVI